MGVTKNSIDGTSINMLTDTTVLVATVKGHCDMVWETAKTGSVTKKITTLDWEMPDEAMYDGLSHKWVLEHVICGQKL